MQVASWWDYGYQTTAMANRTVIVDNNTWNNTHIATVGRAMSSPERKAWKIFRSLDVDYVFVLFGGFIGCASPPATSGQVDSTHLPSPSIAAVTCKRFDGRRSTS